MTTRSWEDSDSSKADYGPPTESNLLTQQELARYRVPGPGEKPIDEERILFDKTRQTMFDVIHLELASRLDLKRETGDVSWQFTAPTGHHPESTIYYIDYESTGGSHSPIIISRLDPSARLIIAVEGQRVGKSGTDGCFAAYRTRVRAGIFDRNFVLQTMLPIEEQAKVLSLWLDAARSYYREETLEFRSASYFNNLDRTVDFFDIKLQGTKH